MTFQTDLVGIEASCLTGGFFVGWPNPPSAEDHLRILTGSSYVVLAREGDLVIGFITAVSDGVSCAYIPYLEVLPTHQGQGIGSELVRRMLNQLSSLYMIDLCCDDDLLPFYKQFGFQPGRAMLKRNYDRQSCAI